MTTTPRKLLRTIALGDTPNVPRDLDNLATDMDNFGPLWLPLMEGSGVIDGGKVVANYFIPDSAGLVQLTTADLLNVKKIILDGTDYSANALLRIKARLMVNATAPAATVTVALALLSSPAGATGAITATVASKSTLATFTTPAANADLVQVSTNTALNGTNFPPGQYALVAALTGGTVAAASRMVLTAQVQTML